MSERPSQFPDAWPTDGRSRIANMLGVGWILTHLERHPQHWEDGKKKWTPIECSEREAPYYSFTAKQMVSQS